MRPTLRLTFAAFVTFAAPALPVVLTGTSANAATPVPAAPATHRPRLVIANRKQARQQVRMVPGNFYYNPTPVYSGDCYDLAIQTRANGNYVARVTQHPGKACLRIDHGTILCPFSIEIDARRGAAVVVGYPYARYGGNTPPKHQALFGIRDAPGIDRISKTDWRLKGTSEPLRDTDQCDLTLNVPAFELMNGYIFTLRAARRPRTLAVSCYVNSVDSSPLKNTAQGALVPGTEKTTLASCPATLKPTAYDSRKPITTSFVSYDFNLHGKKTAYAFVDALERSTRITPSIDQQSMSGLALSDLSFLCNRQKRQGPRHRHDPIQAMPGRDLR